MSEVTIVETVISVHVMTAFEAVVLQLHSSLTFWHQSFTFKF